MIDTQSDKVHLVVANTVLATVADIEMVAVDELDQGSHNYILECTEHLVFEAEVETEDDDSREKIGLWKTD